METITKPAIFIEHGKGWTSEKERSDMTIDDGSDAADQPSSADQTESWTERAIGCLAERYDADQLSTFLHLLRYYSYDTDVKTMIGSFSVFSTLKKEISSHLE
jgi:hypothetical protein